MGRRSRRLTRSRGALQGGTGCATPLTTLTPPPRMTTSAATWRLPIATWRKKLSTMSPAQIQLSSTVRGRRRLRTMDMDKRRLCVRGPRSRIVITFLESRGMQDRCPQVLRKVLQHLPLPSREAELPLRAQEDLRVGDEDSSKEGQEVQLHQGLQGAAQGNLRPMREEVHPAPLWHAGALDMHLQTSRAVQGRGQGVLLQGRESSCRRGVRYEVRYFVFVILMIIFM